MQFVFQYAPVPSYQHREKRHLELVLRLSSCRATRLRGLWLSLLILIRAEHEPEDKLVQRPNQLCFEMLSSPRVPFESRINGPGGRRWKSKRKVWVISDAPPGSELTSNLPSTCPSRRQRPVRLNSFGLLAWGSAGGCLYRPGKKHTHSNCVKNLL